MIASAIALSRFKSTVVYSVSLNMSYLSICREIKKCDQPLHWVGVMGWGVLHYFHLIKAKMCPKFSHIIAAGYNFMQDPI